MTEIQNMIGQSSTEADRIRSYRKKLDEKTSDQKVPMYKCTTKVHQRERKRES